MKDQKLVRGCTEKTVDRKDRIIMTRMGLSKGVLIHPHSHARLFSTKKAVRAMRLIIWIDVTAHGCTEALGRGVRMIRAYIAHRGIAESTFIS
jgi:hypothetical protein